MRNFITFIDSDCQIDYDWIEIHEKYQTETGGVYCGQTISINNDFDNTER